MHPSLLNETEVLRAALSGLPEPQARPFLILVAGLPGSGKSYLSRQLAARLPVVVLETDLLRKAIFPTPTYSAQESGRLFRAVHKLLEQLLGEGIPTILDATNLQEGHRERLYHIAEATRSKLFLVKVDAPEEVVLQRLEARARKREPEENSEADAGVYYRMRSTIEPIGRSHFVIDTSRDLEAGLEKVVRAVRHWMRS